MNQELAEDVLDGVRERRRDESGFVGNELASVDGGEKRGHSLKRRPRD